MPNNAVVDALSKVIDKVLEHSTETTKILVQVIESKDKANAALIEENADLRANLDELTGFIGDANDSDEADADELEEEPSIKEVLVSANKAKQQIHERHPDKTAAHVALELHSKLDDIKDIIVFGKVSKLSPKELLAQVSASLGIGDS